MCLITVTLMYHLFLTCRPDVLEQDNGRFLLCHKISLYKTEGYLERREVEGDQHMGNALKEQLRKRVGVKNKGLFVRKVLQKRGSYILEPLARP